MQTSATFALRHSAVCARYKATFQRHAKESQMTVAVREVELEVLGELEVKKEVQIKEDHRVSLVPDFYHTERKLRPEEERSHSSSRR